MSLVVTSDELRRFHEALRKELQREAPKLQKHFHCFHCGVFLDPEKDSIEELNSRMHFDCALILEIRQREHKLEKRQRSTALNTGLEFRV